MMFYFYLLLLCMFICFGYAAYMKIHYKVSSISESYYCLEKDKEGRGNLFTLWAVITGFLTFIVWANSTPGLYQLTTILSSISLFAVGVFAKYKDEDSWRHTLFTISCAALAFLWSIFVGLWYIPIILVFGTAIYLIYRKRDLIKWLSKDYGRSMLYCLNRISFPFWIEIAAFVSVYISIFIKLL